MAATTNVAIVGGGLAGLTAAAVAARTGASVTLFEAGGETGGRAQTAEREGVRLNIGPHALYRLGAAARILGGLGVTWEGRRPGNSGYALVGSRRRRLPAGPVGFALSGALTARGKAELARVYGGLGKLDTRALDTVTLEDWLSATFRDASARRAFQAFTRVATYANTPELMSAGATIDQLKLGLGGVLYLDGGWATLVESLRRVAEAAGATIRTSTRVSGVERDGEGWSVRTADGGGAHGSAVVIAASPAMVASLVSGEALHTWAAEAVPVKAAVLDVVLDALPNRGGLFALGFDRPTYFSVHSATAKLAPEGQHLVSTAWYRGANGSESDAEVERALEATLDLVQPGWCEHLRYRRFLPDLAVTNDHVRAATAGLEARPGPAVPGLPGLFVAGDWCGSEGMLADAAVASGEAAGSQAAAAARAAWPGGTVAAAG